MSFNIQQHKWFITMLLLQRSTQTKDKSVPLLKLGAQCVREAEPAASVASGTGSAEPAPLLL